MLCVAMLYGHLQVEPLLRLRKFARMKHFVVAMDLQMATDAGTLRTVGDNPRPYLHALIFSLSPFVIPLGNDFGRVFCTPLVLD